MRTFEGFRRGRNKLYRDSDADIDEAVDAGRSVLHSPGPGEYLDHRLVEADVCDEYVEPLTARVADLPAGSAHDEVVVAADFDESQRDEILTYVLQTIEAGATLETGGDVSSSMASTTRWSWHRRCSRA